jgi:hypothetical protein
MSLVLLVIVIGVLNICVGFALGVYVQSTRHAASGPAGLEDDVPLDDNFSPYRSLVRSGESSIAPGAAAKRSES